MQIISPFFCSQTRFGLNHTHYSKKMGGGNLPPKDLVRGPVCWAKMVHFWKPWKHASWPPPECREPFSMLPRHTLSSLMVWNAGAGPWWAATAEIFKIYKSLISPSEQIPIWQTMPGELFNKTQIIKLMREGRQLFNTLNNILKWSQQNNRDPKRFSGCRLMKTRTFPCQ